MGYLRLWQKVINLFISRTFFTLTPSQAVTASTEKQVDVVETDTEKLVNSDTIFLIFPRFL